MNILKQILFVAIGLFLLYQGVALTKILMSAAPSDLGGLGTKFFLAFLVNLYFTGTFAFPGFVFPTARLLPDAYYNIKHPDAVNQLFRILGVKYFKVLLLVFFWGKKKNKKKYFSGNRAGFENFICQTKQSEFGHLGALIFVVIVSFLLILNGQTTIALFATVINLIGNFYPIVLQRHHRIRLEQVMRIA